METYEVPPLLSSLPNRASSFQEKNVAVFLTQRGEKERVTTHKPQPEGSCSRGDVLGPASEPPCAGAAEDAHAGTAPPPRRPLASYR